MPDYQLMPDRLDDDLLRYAMECSKMNNPDGAATIKAIYSFLLEAAATNAEVKAARQRAQSSQAMADCMDMVKRELVQAGVVGEDVPPMFVADAVLGRLGHMRAVFYNNMLRAYQTKTSAEILAEIDKVFVGAAKSAEFDGIKPTGETT